MCSSSNRGSRSWIRQLLPRIEELRISTFHGFCLGLLRENAQALDLPPDLRVGDDEDLWARFEGAFVEFLRTREEIHPALRLHEPARLRDLAWKLLQPAEERTPEQGHRNRPISEEVTSEPKLP